MYRGAAADLKLYRFLFNLPGTTVFLVIGKEIARKKLLLICCHRPTRIKFHAHLKNNPKKFHIT